MVLNKCDKCGEISGDTGCSYPSRWVNVQMQLPHCPGVEQHLDMDLCPRCGEGLLGDLERYGVKREGQVSG